MDMQATVSKSLAGDMRQVGGLAGSVRGVALGVLASHICSEGMPLPITHVIIAPIYHYT